MAKCPHDPRVLAGQPIGMYHCPDCGEMVVAGMEHTPKNVLPDCMMPDGADPCLGHQQVRERLRELQLERIELQGKNDGLQKHIGTLERRLEALHERFGLPPSSRELPK